MRTLKELREQLREHKENRQLRHAPSECSLCICDHSSSVPIDQWEACIPNDRVFMRLEYLRAVELSTPSDFRLRYVLIYHEGKTVGAAVFQVFTLGGEDLGGQHKKAESSGAMAAVKKGASHIAKGIGKHVHLSVLLCGNSFLSGEHGIYIADGVDRELVMHAVADAAYRVRRSDKLHGNIDVVMIKDFYADLDSSAQFLKRFNYRRFEVDPNMILNIRDDWQSFDDYLKAMSSKYRSRAKSAIKKSKQLELCEWELGDLENNVERINELYQAVHAKANFRICEVTPRYFIECKRSLGERFVFKVFKLDNQILAFYCLVKWGDHLEAHTIGLDYDFNTKHALYQNILYDSVRVAIKLGCNDVIYGRTAMEMKSCVGATAQEMSCYMRHKGPVRNRLIKPLFSYLKPSTWTPRSPFKEVDA